MWSSDAIQRHKSGSTIQLMACCLMAPSHYLNQCWLFIIETRGHLVHGNFAETVLHITRNKMFENHIWYQKILYFPGTKELTHSGRVTHICVSRLTITGSDNDLSPGQSQAIIWTNAGILLIGPVTNFSENLIEILTSSFTKMRLNVSSAKMAAILPRPQCVKLKVMQRHSIECQ